MERELWAALSQAISQVQLTWKESARFTHPTSRIVRVHLWSVLHDRPTCWACEKQNWDWRTLPEALPDQSTMSRRMKSKLFDKFMDAVAAKLNGTPAQCLVWRLDGKPLPVAGHTTDPDAGYGKGQRLMAKGYKLHALWSENPLPDDWAVTPLNVCEKQIARRFLTRIQSEGGYLLNDGNYDDSISYDLAGARNLQMLAPRARPGTGLGHRYQSEYRKRAIAMLEAPAGLNEFGRTLHQQRKQIERDFGNLTSFGGGLGPLPAWVRRPWRVRRWVYGKLLINAGRIRRAKHPGGGECARLLLLIGTGRHKDPRQSKIARQFDIRHGDDAHARVFCLSHENIGDFHTDLIRDSRRSFIGRL